jgi:hypothetical protein
MGKKGGILIPLPLANERVQSPQGSGNIATLSKVNNLAYAAIYVSWLRYRQCVTRGGTIPLHY